MNSKNKKNKTNLSNEKKQNTKLDKKPLNKTSKVVKKTFPLPPQPENYKQINELYENGKLELVDYKGNITECNIYGCPAKKFLDKITGTINFKERLEKGLIEEYQYNSKSLYIPKTLNFEGSYMFPRPLSLPFVNQTENPDKLIKEVKKEGRISQMKNKKIFSLKRPLKDLSTIPSFICHKIGKNNPKDRNHLIRLIDNYITEKKEEHQLETDYLEKASCIKALRNYKKKLNENMTNELYNGKKIPPTNQKDIMLKYNSIRKAIFNNGIKISKRAGGAESEKIINLEIYKQLYKIKGVGNEKNIFKHPEKLREYKLTENNIEENVENTNSNEMIYYKTLFPQKNKMLKTYSLFPKPKFKMNKEKSKGTTKENIEKYIDDEKFKKTITTGFERNNNESLMNTFYVNTEHNKSSKNNSKNLYIPNKLFLDNKSVNNNTNIINYDKYSKTSNSFHKNKISNFTKSKEVIDINNISNIINKDNYSYKSEDKKEENNLMKKFKNGHNYKSIKELRIKTEHENKLLKGFISPDTSNDLKYFKIYKLKKKDSAFKHYLNELELIKKVNSISLEKEKRMNLFRDNLLRKKLQGKKILEQNQKK